MQPPALMVTSTVDLDPERVGGKSRWRGRCERCSPARVVATQAIAQPIRLQRLRPGEPSPPDQLPVQPVAAVISAMDS